MYPHVTVERTDGLVLEGLLILEEADKITLKLENGYNVILHRDEIKRIAEREEGEAHQRGKDGVVQGEAAGEMRGEKKKGGETREEGEGKEEDRGGQRRTRREGEVRGAEEKGGKEERKEKGGRGGEEGEEEKGDVRGEKEEEKKEGMRGEDDQKRGEGWIVIINTGGTIASRVEYETGAVKPGFSAEDILNQYPFLRGELIRTRDAYSILSEDARFAHYNILARIVYEELSKENVQGIIIAHGTDTMHYTAAALRFALGRIEKPVILIGSQRSSDRPSTDARVNLTHAIRIIRAWPNQLPPNVYILMHATILREETLLIEGVWARKMHSSRRDAFESINKPPAAWITEKGVRVNASYTPPRVREEDTLRLFNEELRIGMLMAHPNMHADEILAFNQFDGLVILGTGFGHVGVVLEENKPLLEAIRRVAQRIPVVMTRQTIRGVTNLNVYTAGRLLQAAGVMGHACDMTPETAFIKLAWLLSQKKTLEEIRREFHTPIRGECQDARSILDWNITGAGKE